MNKTRVLLSLSLPGERLKKKYIENTSKCQGEGIALEETENDGGEIVVG